VTNNSELAGEAFRDAVLWATMAGQLAEVEGALVEDGAHERDPAEGWEVADRDDLAAIEASRRRLERLAGYELRRHLFWEART